MVKIRSTHMSNNARTHRLFLWATRWVLRSWVTFWAVSIVVTAFMVVGRVPLPLWATLEAKLLPR